jgi:hypothetical protein
MRRHLKNSHPATLIWSLLALLPALSLAQVPVDENGKSFGAEIEAVGEEDIPRLSAYELQELVGPIALYPDDLLAVVLPASTYPLQVIEAERFLERLEDDPTLKPDESWDDSIIALINYPEVVELMNEDLDWTWRLGEAVVAQQADVIAAVETFRDRAYAAGNLKSDGYQEVTRDSGVVSIQPVAEDVIYVPYYEPTRVVVRQPRPVYYYYPRPYPVYYYPYPSSYAFDRGYFWGVTTAFTIGWRTHHLSVFHPSYYGHPYFGYTYWDRWWYRRPTINVYNNVYVRNTPARVTVNRYYSGDQWRPSRHSGIVKRVTRNEYYPSPRRQSDEHREDRRTNSTHVVPNRSSTPRVVTQSQSGRSDVRTSALRERERETISFRERPKQQRAEPVRSVPRTVNEPTRSSERRLVTRQPTSRQAAPPTTRQRVSRSTPVPRQETRQAPQHRESQPRQAPQRRESQPRQAPRQEPRQTGSPARAKAPEPKREPKRQSDSSRERRR